MYSQHYQKRGKIRNFSPFGIKHALKESKANCHKEKDFKGLIAFQERLLESS